jgi:hypothetical protein
MAGIDEHLDVEPQVPQQGGRRRRREPVDRLLGNPYLEFDAGTDAHTRCEKLRQMETAPGFHIDMDYFQSIGAWERFRDIVGDDTPWDRMFQVCL